MSELVTQVTYKEVCTSKDHCIVLITPKITSYDSDSDNSSSDYSSGSGRIKFSRKKTNRK